MPVAMSSVGFAGSIGELDLAEMWSRAGGRYGVLGAGDLSCTVIPTADRTVRIDAGSAWGHGVLATLEADANVQFDLSASGTRWDMVVVRRTWSPPGGTAELDVVKGVTAQQVSAFTQRKERAYPTGLVDEQPLWLVPITAGQQEPGLPVDIRCWFANGGMVAKSDIVRQYLDEPGTHVTIGGTQWTYDIGANGSLGWVRPPQRLSRVYAIAVHPSGRTPVTWPAFPTANLVVHPAMKYLGVIGDVGVHVLAGDIKATGCSLVIFDVTGAVKTSGEYDVMVTVEQGA